MNWDETVQGFVLGSFFYGYAVSQVIIIIPFNSCFSLIILDLNVL